METLYKLTLLLGRSVRQTCFMTNSKPRAPGQAGKGIHAHSCSGNQGKTATRLIASEVKSLWTATGYAWRRDPKTSGKSFTLLNNILRLLTNVGPQEA